MAEHRFRCTSCGKCCIGAPELTLVEAASLYREFVPMLRLGGVADFARMPLAQQQKALSDGIGVQDFRDQFDWIASLGALTISTGGVRIAIRLSAAPLSSPALARCPQLDGDGKCAIWERRPALCRSLPLDFWAPEGQQPLRLRAMAKHVAEDGYQCDMGDGAPAIWRDGAIVDPAHRAAWEDGVRRSKEEWPVLTVLAKEMEAGSTSLPSIPQIGGAVLSGEAYHLDFFGVLGTLHVFRDSGSAERAGVDLSGLPGQEEFLVAQLGLIEAQLASNLSRKAPADRPVTEKLRMLEKHYRRALAERPWEEDAA
jgi:Fe-S-cluster containining protein